MSADISKFRGSTVALITPFQSDYSVDEARLRSLVDWHIEKGTDVILACGTTGESATLSHEEHHRVIDIIIDHAAGRIPVMAGAGSNSTAEAISLTQHASKAGADAILSVGPYYNKPTQAGYFEHFKAIAGATEKPIFIYNVPGRTAGNICGDTILQLAQIDNIIGVKEAGGNMSQIMNILSNRPNDFLVLSGDDSLSFAMLALGADGVISVAANEAPSLFGDMVHSALAGDWDKARVLHYKLLPLMEFNFCESNPTPVKTACSMLGLNEDILRLPLMPMSSENKQRMQLLLRDIGLLS